MPKNGFFRIDYISIINRYLKERPGEWNKNGVVEILKHLEEIRDSAPMPSNQAMLNLKANPSESLLSQHNLSGVDASPHYVEIGAYNLRDDVELFPGESKQGLIYAKEQMVNSNEYEIILTYRSQPIPNFENKINQPWELDKEFKNDSFHVTLLLDSGSYTITNFYPYGLDSTPFPRHYAKSGAAEVIFSYLLNAIRVSGNNLSSSGLTKFKAMRFYLTNIFKLGIWPARVILKGESYDLSDSKFRGEFFDQKYIGQVSIELTSGSSVIVSLNSLGNERYEVVDNDFPEKRIIVRFSDFHVLANDKVIGQVQDLEVPFIVEDFISTVQIVNTRKIKGSDLSDMDTAMTARKKIEHINKDRAQFNSVQQTINNGGIDFTQNKTFLETQNSGQGIQFHLDPAMLQELQNASGFTPVIIGIQPLGNVRAFLGMNDSLGIDKSA